MATNITPDVSGIRLAPDLTLPSDIVNAQPFEAVTFDPSGSLTEALGLSGKFAIYGLTLTGMPTTEIVTVKLTVDGNVIWNAVGFTPTSATISLYGRIDTSTEENPPSPFICRSSLSLEVETVADSSVTLNHFTRPIL